MENAAEALLMGGSVLLFIIALTVTMSSFTTLRAGIDDLLDQAETIELAKDSEGYINYMESESEGSIRKVGIETIVPTITRAMKENYVVYIKLNNINDVTYQQPYYENGVFVTVATENVSINIDGTNQTIVSIGDKLIKVTIGYDTNQDINNKLKDKLYEDIKDKTFYEYLGEYQEDTDAPDAEKVRHRIITYVETPPVSTIP